MVMARIIKRLSDFLVALVGLLILSPLILAIAIAIYINMGSPIVFSQPRPGKNAWSFIFYKFRTMKDEYDANGNFLPDEQRITPLGRFLRRTSLDELPQLWNILKGEMSLVGPRPLLHDYLPYYSETEMKRHNMLPGVTGLAQVNGRNKLPWNERLALDVYYVENWSFLLDCQIILKTIFKVLKSDSVTVVPNVLMKDLHDERQSLEAKEGFTG